MSSHLKTLAVILWATGVLTLTLYMASEQSKFLQIDKFSTNWSQFKHFDHLLAMKPAVLMPYLLLVGSGLAYLFGAGRHSLEPKQRRWILFAFLVSLVTYANWLFIMR